MSVKALIAAYEARTDKSSPVVDFYRVVLKSANGKDVREKTSRTGYKAGQAPGAELHFHVKFDKTADLRESVADMTRAVNHIRGKHRLELKRKTGRLREGEVELRRWDEHSNTERWDKEATDLKTASVSASVGFSHENNGVGSLQSWAAARRRDRQKHDRHVLFVHQQNYDLWGVQAVLTNNPFMARATELRSIKDEALDQDLRSLDQQLEDAIFLEDESRVRELLEEEGVHSDLRVQGKLLLKRLDKDQARARQRQERIPGAQDPTTPQTNLVCRCEPEVFVTHGRCMCSFAETLPAPLRQAHHQFGKLARSPASLAPVASEDAESMQSRVSDDQGLDDFHSEMDGNRGAASTPIKVSVGQLLIYMCLCLRMSVCLSVCMYVCLSVCMSLCLSVCMHAAAMHVLIHMLPACRRPNQCPAARLEYLLHPSQHASRHQTCSHSARGRLVLHLLPRATELRSVLSSCLSRRRCLFVSLGPSVACSLAPALAPCSSFAHTCTDTSTYIHTHPHTHPHANAFSVNFIHIREPRD